MISTDGFQNAMKTSKVKYHGQPQGIPTLHKFLLDIGKRNFDKVAEDVSYALHNHITLIIA